MNFEPIAESDEAHIQTWNDISKLNYWARKIGYTKLDKNYRLQEAQRPCNND